MFIPEARSHRLPNKRSLLPSVCCLPLKVLIEVAWRFYPKITDIVIVLGCLPEMDGKILLLKNQRLDTGYGKKSLDGAIKSSGEQSLTVIPICSRFELCLNIGFYCSNETP